MQVDRVPELRTPRLLLRPVHVADWKSILHLRSDPQVNARVQRPLATDKQDALTFIERVCGTQAGLMYWGIAPAESEPVIGSICLWKFSADRTTAEVGYDLSVANQGKGYMTEAMNRVLEFGFAALGLEVIEAYTQSNNQASLKLLERFGFLRLTDRQDPNNPLNWILELRKCRWLSQH